jgi:hypothetical protein
MFRAPVGPRHELGDCGARQPDQATAQDQAGNDCCSPAEQKGIDPMEVLTHEKRD